MMVFVPAVLLTLLYFMYEDNPLVFDRVALLMLGIFPFILMFLVTSIAMLRERTTGTLERLFTTPAAKADLLFGYGLAFGLVATVEATVATLFSAWFLDLDAEGNLGLVVLIAVTNALLGVALGLLFSAFAQSEFQAVQFMPVVAMPQILLCGLFVPRDEMASWLNAISDVLPLSYAVEALQEVGANADPTGTMWRDLFIVLAVVVLSLVLGAATLRRRTP
jgi:ABC-2 type transport system permease protein